MELFNSHKDFDITLEFFQYQIGLKLMFGIISKEKIDLPSLYFLMKELCIRNGVILSQLYLKLNNKEKVKNLKGLEMWYMSITGAVQSKADNIDTAHEVIETRTTERDSRVDDKRGGTSMEDRKQGYFNENKELLRFTTAEVLMIKVH